MSEKKLQALPHATKKFEQIDALRFFAVAPVLVAHWEMFNFTGVTAFLLGSNGVNLFFAISGFLITLGLIKNKDNNQSIKTSLCRFYIRRFLRIFPIYYLLLWILWLFARETVVDGIWWYLTYTANFYCIKIQNWGGIGHLWSLSIEEQFYWVWPLLILFTPKRFLPILFGITISSSILFKAYIVYTGAAWWIFYMNPIGVLDILCLGALLSYGYSFYTEKLKLFLCNRVVTVFVFLQVGIVIYFRLTQHYSFIYDIFNRFSFGLFSIWVIGRATFGFKGIIGYILNLRALKYIGKISYGVYLFHAFAPMMVSRIKYPIDNNLRGGMYFIVTIIVCSFSWYFFESPILQFKNKFE